MVSNVINVRLELKNNNTLKISKRKTKEFNISADAIQEEISFLKAIIERHMQIAMELAHDQKRKTVQAEDIIQANGRRLE
jgi:histone H3/H4